MAVEALRGGPEKPFCEDVKVMPRGPQNVGEPGGAYRDNESRRWGCSKGD